MSDWFKGKTYLDPDMTQDNGGEWVHIEDVSALLAEVRVANEAFQESDAACADLEGAMRDIQAATSDKAVLAITDKALCDPVSTRPSSSARHDSLCGEKSGRKCGYERNQ